VTLQYNVKINPPTNAFTQEDAEIHFDDWLSTIERAAACAKWNESETLMQFAGFCMVEL